MALKSVSGFMPDWPNEEIFLRTLEEREKAAPEDLISIYSPVYKYYKNMGFLEVVDDIGPYNPITVQTQENKTVKTWSGFDDADNAPSEGLKQAQALYGHLTAVEMYNYENMIKSSGRTQRIDLMKVMRDQTEGTVNNLLENILMGTQVADGRTPDSFGAVVAYDGALHSVDPTAVSWGDLWQPVKTYKTGTTPFALATEFRTGMRKFVRALKLFDTRMRLFIAGEDVYDAAQAWAEDKLRVTFGDIKSSKGWGDSEMFDVNGRTWVYSDKLAAKTVWGINPYKCRIRVHSGTNMKYGPWENLPGKVATRKRTLLHIMSVYTRDRRVNGSITFS